MVLVVTLSLVLSAITQVLSTQGRGGTLTTILGPPTLNHS